MQCAAVPRQVCEQRCVEQVAVAVTEEVVPVGTVVGEAPAVVAPGVAGPLPGLVAPTVPAGPIAPVAAPIVAERLAVGVAAPLVAAAPQLVAHPNGAVTPVDEPAVAAARAEHLALLHG